MKKICAFILSVLMFSAVNLPILAENTNLSQDNKPEIITCDENSTDEMCKSLEISKTEITLKSYLKRDYKAYEFTFKNISQNDLEIVKIDKFQIANEAIKVTKQNRFRLYKAAKSLIRTPIYIVIIPTVLFDESGSFYKRLYHFIFNDSEGHDEDIYFAGMITALTYPISAPLLLTQGILSSSLIIITSPILYIMDFKQDKNAKKETKLFPQEVISTIIKQNDTQKLILLSKIPVSKNEIQLKDIETGKIYSIEK